MFGRTSRKAVLSVLATTAFWGISIATFADYPLVSHRYLADPTGLEYNGRLYLYCSSDTDNDPNGGYAMRSITCISSDDLKNWTDHGEVLRAPRDVSWATYSWAPSVITNNGLIYLYFGNGASGIGVATSSVPAGPFKDARGSVLINSSTPGAATANQWYFDPCIFVDGGQRYLYFGGADPTNARVILLNSDLTSVSGSASPMTAPNFFEASHLHKRGGIYYFSYSSRPSAGLKIQYATNSNPTSGLVFQGDVLANPPNNDYNNNHHSFFTFQGNWYVAYHNRYVAQQNGIPTTYKRNVCLDALNYNPDGTMQQVVFTTDGLDQFKYLNPYTRVEAETMAAQSGIFTAPCVAGGMNVTDITNGTWTMVRGVDFRGSGATNFVARIAGAGAGGNIELRRDSLNGTLIGTCVVPATGGWQTWAEVSCAVSSAAARDVHDLYLKFTGAGATNLFNFDWWRFESASSDVATEFNLKASDGIGSSSFDTIGNWVTNGTLDSATTPPGPGGVYDTGPYTLRTPTAGSAVTFGGDSLTLSPGAPAATGSLLLKGPDGATTTINELILSGGVLAQGVNSGLGGIQWVAGYINIVSNSVFSGLGTAARYIGIAANISGTGSLSNDCYVIYTGNNNGLIGSVSVGGGGAIQISDAVNLGGDAPSFNAAQLLLNNGALVANSSVTLANANGGVTLGSGGGAFTNLAGSTLTVLNPVAGPGGLIFHGSGGLILAGTNSYSGATTVNKGKLSFLAPKTGTGNISLANGTALAVSAGGTQILPTTLALGTSAGVTLEFENITSTAAAPIAAGTLSSGGTVSIKVNSGSFVAGQSYPLLAWSSGAAPAVNLSALSGATGSLSTNGNSIRLNISSTNATLVKFEAESGALGAQWALSNNSSPAYITITTDSTGYNPGSAARVATYTLTFPAAGTYELYARVRVGSGTYNDDSLFYGNGFGVKNPVLDSDWIFINGIASGGFTAAADIVTGGGTAGSGVWKWINLSQFTIGPIFTVTSGNLTQTFQIGARENGLDLDAFAFGLNGVTYTVADLDAGVDGTWPSGIATINWNDARQQIDGFGAGVVFLDAGLSPITDANADKLFKSDTTSQLGLSLLRVRIAPNSTWSSSVSAWNDSVSDAKKAAARGAGVLATPWTPPAAMKDSGVLTNGSLLPAQYANYAAYLKKYADNMLSNGVSLRAISVQNEPDWGTTYESCVWTTNQLLNFFRTNAAAIGSTPVMMPESLGFNFNYSDPTLNDPVAVTNVDLVGGHLYGVTTIQDYPNAHAKGKPTWMTEYLENDQTIESAIGTASEIHDCLTAGNMSAYIWWKCLGDANGLLNAAGVIQKRGYVMSQFSRFVRPGHYRMGETNLGSGSVSAYKSPNGTQFAIIAINPYSLAFNQTINLTNFPSVSLTPWITSATQSLAAQTPFVVSNATFTYNLPALSIVTFVGQANTAPQLTTTGPSNIDAGVTLILTNVAADPDLPSQTLTFSLLNTPAAAELVTVNATNAQVIWRPPVSAAGTTDWITVKVADSGVPSLSATNSLAVTVNPLSSQPWISSIVPVGGNQYGLEIAGPAGPDYSLWISTNLLNWALLFTSNSPAPPFTLTLTNGNEAARFYRIQIGP